MILSHQQIKEYCKKGEISITPYDESQIQGASYDLRVGDQGGTTSGKKLVRINETGFLTIKPGDFAIIITLEQINLGAQYVGRFGLRSKFARKGLIATTGPQIDPGFHGRLIVGLTNLSPKPISISHKDDFLSVEIHRLEHPTEKPYDGPYQDKLELGPEEIEAITEREGMALSEVLTTLQSLSQNMGALTKDIDTLKWVIGIGVAVVAIAMAVVGAIVVLK
ncbi:MAG TPA: dCTP deaminase [Verrucomicrobiae bacterium]|nr:dCTP deaminase [Verrucomicrobiae bacterium]